MIEKRVEKNLTIPTGYACNNFCRFCMEADRQERYEYVKKFTDSRVYEVLEKNKNVERVIFASGEPTLNPELVNYVKFAKKLGFKNIGIISNGRRYAYRDFCLELISAGVNEFIISLHGHNKKIHEFLTRAPGSFEQTKAGLANISGLRHKLSKILVSHVVNKVNCMYTADFLSFLKEFLIDHVTFLVVQPRGRNMENDFFDLMPKYKDLANFFEAALKSNPELFVSNISPDIHYLSILDLPLCFSENLVPYIGFGEVRLIEINSKMAEVTNIPYKIKGRKCLSCAYLDVCEGVFENYIKNYGWGEFKAVIKKNNKKNAAS